MSTNKSLKLLKGLVATGLILISHAAVAKTLYVATWGADSPTCGATASPCETIQQAIDNSKKNGKIIVAPGLYEENLSINDDDTVDRTGLKLESEAGRFATTIKAVAAMPVIKIEQAKVQIGKISKGFTLDGAGLNSFGIESHHEEPDEPLCDGCKIQGNRTIDTNAGIYIDGLKLQIRDNIVEAATNSPAILCGDCDKSLIQDNTTLDSGSTGIATGSSTGISILRNKVSNAGFSSTGISVNGTQVKLIDNLVEGGSETNTGIDVLKLSKTTIQGNIVTGAGNGFALFNNTTPLATTIKNNLAFENSENGFAFGQNANIKFENNSAIANNGDNLAGRAGMRLNAPAIKSFKNNNSYKNPVCDLENSSGAALTFSKQFFGMFGPCGGPLPDGTTVDKPNTTNVKKAAAL